MSTLRLFITVLAWTALSIFVVLRACVHNEAALSAVALIALSGFGGVLMGSISDRSKAFRWWMFGDD